MNKTKIEWTDYTWNPVTGCTKVSQGCKNCYAERLTKRFSAAMGDFRDVRVRPERLAQPRKVKKPSKVFVCDVSDLFHEDVPFEFIVRVFGVMKVEASWHTYQVLTKRIDRVIDFIQWWYRITNTHFEWPSNVWIGTSCEDQKTADERIPHLLKVPAAIRFLSCEPLLGPIHICQSIRRYMFEVYGSFHTTFFGDKLHWVIVGGESGPKARPVNPEWIRDIKNECKTAGVAFFFKQWGEYMPYERHKVDSDYFVSAGSTAAFEMGKTDFLPIKLKAEPIVYRRMGKTAAGHSLDGNEYRQFPSP